MISQNALKQRVKYDPESGVWLWVSNFHKSKIGRFAGCVNKKGYLVISIGGTQYRAHRLAFLYMEGIFPKKEVDHINHIPLDNRWVNLRHADSVINGRNQSMPKNNTSGIVGVSWKPRDRLWEPYISSNKARLFLGSTDDFFEACCRRKSAENIIGYHKNHGAPPRTSQQEKCPCCGEYGIVQLPSMNKKICTGCKAEFDWKLKSNQKSVLIKWLKG